MIPRVPLASLAPSTTRAAGMKPYRALLNIRDMRAGGLLEREREARCQAICCHTPNNNKITCNLLLQIVKRLSESGQKRLD